MSLRSAEKLTEDLTQLIAKALELADSLQMDMVALRLSEALDALKPAEGTTQIQKVVQAASGSRCTH
jgi:hypothetical protein